MGISATRATSSSAVEEHTAPAADQTSPPDETLLVDNEAPSDASLSSAGSVQHAPLHPLPVAGGSTAPTLSVPPQPGVGARRPILTTPIATRDSLEESLYRALREDRTRQSDARGVSIDGLTATIPEIDATAIERIAAHALEQGDSLGRNLSVDILHVNTQRRATVQATRLVVVNGEQGLHAYDTSGEHLYSALRNPQGPTLYFTEHGRYHYDQSANRNPTAPVRPVYSTVTVPGDMFGHEEDYSEFVTIRMPETDLTESGVVQLIDLSPGEADWRRPEWSLNTLFEDAADWVHRVSDSDHTPSDERTEPSLLLMRDGAGRELYTDPDGADRSSHSEAMGEAVLRQDPELARRIDSIARNPDSQARESELRALLENQYDEAMDQALAALRHQFTEELAETAQAIAIEFGKDAVLTALTGGLWGPIELATEIAQLSTAAFSAHHHYELVGSARDAIADPEYDEAERAQIAKSALGANARLAAEVVRMAGFLGQIGLTKLAVETGKVVSRSTRAGAISETTPRARTDSTTPRASSGSDAELDTVAPASGRAVEAADAVRPETPPLEFGDRDLVFGPSAGGRLRGLQQEAGGRLLTDVPKPPHLGWVDFSLGVLRSHLDDGGVVRFDLTHMRDIPDALRGVGEFADTVTAHELRFLRDAMDSYPGQVRFYRDGAEVEPPW